MKRLIILVLAFLQPSCATIASNIALSKDGSIHFPSEYEAYNHCITSRIYSGTQVNFAIQQTPPGGGGNIFGLFFLPDIPLSLAADTALLPYTLPQSMADKDPKDCK